MNYIWLHISSKGGACELTSIAVVTLSLLNKFGKLQAENRAGLIPAFGAAMEAHIPILTSVSPKLVNAWSTFAAPLFVAGVAAGFGLSDIVLGRVFKTSTAAACVRGRDLSLSDRTSHGPSCPPLEV